MTTTPPTRQQTIKQVVRDLSALLPDDWSLRMDAPARRDRRPDFTARIEAPDGTEQVVLIECKTRMTPRAVDAAVHQLQDYADEFNPQTLVIAAPYLTEMTRERISELGANYIDSTGNVLLRANRPALLIRQAGAKKDPWPSDETLRSLRGRGTARAVRAVLDIAPPYGIRDLAARSEVPLGSLSRTVDLLDREGLVTRSPRGPITDVDWPRVLRRWAKDYDVATSNRVATYLEPRGVPAFAARLATEAGRYAATGAFAAQRFAPIAPARIAALYVDDVTEWADRLELRATDTGANVWLLEPYDPVVFDRTTERDNITCVSATQLAVDLLTGPGRDPAEGEELLEWMERNEDAWRSR